MIYNYCPGCGLKGGVQCKDDTHHQCHACQWEDWNNPRSAVGLILLNEQRNAFLAAERGREPKKGMYDLPGGFLEYNEDPAAGAAREALEEMGIRIAPPHLIGAYSNEYIPNKVSTCDLIYVVPSWQGDINAADDVASLVWKPFSFFTSNQFAARYPGIIPTLKAYLQRH